MFPTSSFLQIPSHDGHPCFWLYPSHYRADSGLTPVRNGAVAISFNDTRYSINRNTVLDDIVCIWLNATAPIKTLKTCIYTGYQRFNRLFELFFQFVASPVLHCFFLQIRIILMRFYLSFICFQSWCTHFVPKKKFYQKLRRVATF